LHPHLNMSYLRQKSDFNLDAAKELISKEIYAPSVHCSYYSCFQLMKFSINDFFGITYKEQSSTIASTKQSSHQYVINYILKELKEFDTRSEVQKLSRKIKDLKQYRVDSDYEDIEVNIEKGELALSIAEEIRMYLITNFHL
jgi:uncharacterized protein (UPF0332 family)